MARAAAFGPHEAKLRSMVSATASAHTKASFGPASVSRYTPHLLQKIHVQAEQGSNPQPPPSETLSGQAYEVPGALHGGTAVLDPRYKLNLVSYYFRKIYDNADTSQHITRVVALLNRLFTEYQKSSCSSSVGTNLLECHIKDDFFDDYSPPKEISELDWYLESPVMVRSVDLDILKFWSGMSNCYPNLANLARDILAIPVSTVATKSAFTIGKKILNYRRSGLSPYLLEMVICLHDWTCPKDRNGIAL
ncbi:hypothetical protein C2845_PM15G01610 [Panicum miliaceum]|uniref:HAT C-terminal dimerisation domain-containing protein n=1 Tax=Panicum miliaceum TaxID=4540 RepID=A0A3L6QDJ4_PANMI|nr:hypothetical protein C2845_PM15G01610 [Panicum miliaceum]